MTALVDRHAQRMMSMIAAKLQELATTPLRQTIRIFIEALIMAQRMDVNLLQAMLQQVPNILGRDEMYRLDRQMIAFLRIFLESRRAEIKVENPAAAAFVIFQAIRGATVAAVLESPETLSHDVLVHELSMLAMGYLLAN